MSKQPIDEARLRVALVTALKAFEWYWCNSDEDAPMLYRCASCGEETFKAKGGKHWPECSTDAAIKRHAAMFPEEALKIEATPPT